MVSYRGCVSGMPKPTYRREKSQFLNVGFSIIPIFGLFYVLAVLPLLPDDGQGRVENILFWPVAAALTFAIVLQNRSQVDNRFFRSLPIISLIAYFLFAAASVSWAHSPDYAF